MAILYDIDFSGATNGTALTSVTRATGANNMVNWGGVAKVYTTGGRAYTSFDAGGGTTTGEGFPANVKQTWYARRMTGVNDAMQCVSRFIDTSNYRDILVYDSSLIVWDVVTGAPGGYVEKLNVSITTANNTDFTIGIESEGNDHRVYKDGSMVGSFSSSNLSAAGAAGFVWYPAISTTTGKQMNRMTVETLDSPRQSSNTVRWVMFQ